MRKIASLAALGLLAACSVLRSLDDYSTDPVTDAAAPRDAGVDVVLPTPPDASEAGALSTQADRYAAAVLRDNPIAFFRLRDAPGSSKLKNEIDDAYVATLVGGTLGVAGPFSDGSGLGASFAVSRFVEVSSADAGETTFDFLAFAEHTFEFWVRVAKSEASKRHILSNMDVGNSGPTTGSWLFVETKGLKSERWVAPTHWHYAYADLVAGPDRFVHVVLSFKDNRQRLYIDGVEGEGEELKKVDGGMRRSLAPMRFGAADTTMSEVAVYEKALSLTQITAHLAAAGSLAP